MHRRRLVALGAVALCAFSSAPTMWAQTTPAAPELVPFWLVRPAYPPIARAARVQGVVIVALTVGTDGRVESASIERDVPLLSRGALAAAMDSGFICRDCTGPMTYRLKYDFWFADSIEEVEAARAVVTSTSGTLPVVFWTPAVTLRTASGPRPTSGRSLEDAEQEP